MKKLTSVLVALFCFLSLSGTVFAADVANTRIKDIAKVQGVRANQLTGYGLVVGLNGTGDSNKMTQTIQSIGNMLRHYGIMVDVSGLKPKNVASVMVTATLPPFVREGDTIDATISSMGDAKSIQGGVLIQTPLQAGNGNVYAVAQGPVSTGGFSVGRSTQKNFSTVGVCSNGAIVEQTVEDDLGNMSSISLSLKNPDFTTATRIAQAVNAQYGGIATPANPGRVDVNVPQGYRRNIVSFVAGLEDLYVSPDNIAKIVINERTGTIIMGGNTSIDAVAITQGSLSVKIQRVDEAVQPSPFSFGTTVQQSNVETDVTEEKASSIVLPATAEVNDVVGALNSVGATPREIISILQALKASGALHAELEMV